MQCLILGFGPFWQSATLTDDLFKNVHEQLTSGLLLNYISDHLPVFVKLSKHRDNSLVGLNEPTYKLVRMETPERTEALKLDVANYSCDKLYADADQFFIFFIFCLFRSILYTKHCPVRKYW